MTIIYILNGPNLNLLGTREPEVYGTQTLADIEAMTHAHAKTHGVSVVFFQSNSEGALIDAIHAAGRDGAGLILNAGAYTHTSVALHDALKAVTLKKIEVHLSNPAAREAFRHTSFVAPAVHGSICGLGAIGYRLAIDAIIDMINKT